MYLGSFNVLRVDAVVANVGVGQRDDLLTVTRVRQNFLVTGHGGVEHKLADRGASSSYGISNKHRTVC